MICWFYSNKHSIQGKIFSSFFLGKPKYYYKKGQGMKHQLKSNKTSKRASKGKELLERKIKGWANYQSLIHHITLHLLGLISSFIP